MADSLSSSPSSGSISSRSDRPYSHMMAYLNRDLEKYGYKIINIWSISSSRKYGFGFEDVPLKKRTCIYIPKEKIDGFMLDRVVATVLKYYHTRPFKDNKKAAKIKLRRKIRV